MQKNETYRHVLTGHIVKITDAGGSWIHYKNLTLGTENSKPKYVFNQFYKKIKNETKLNTKQETLPTIR